jgi:soluble lytic murein transglycosylase
VFALLTSLLAMAPVQSDADPAVRCRQLGEMALLGDDEAYFNQAKRHPKSACEQYHAAMSAVALFDERKEPGLLYRARGALQRLHDELAAATALEDQALRDWVAFRRAEIAWRQRDAKTSGVLDGLSSEFPLRQRAFVLAETLRGFSEPRTAFAALQTKPLPKGRLRLMQLQALLAFGRLAGGDARLMQGWQRELWTDYPDAFLAPKQIDNPTLDEIDARFTVLHNRHANGEVLRQSAVLLRDEPDQEMRCRLLYYRGAALRKLRQYFPAERTLSDARSACQLALGGETRAKDKTEDALKRAWYLLVQVQTIARPFTIAEATGRAFAAAYPSDALTDDVLAHVAASAKKEGEDEASREWLARVVSDHPDGDVCPEASFRIAYHAYRDGAFEDAANGFAAMANGPCKSDAIQKARALYWQSRSLSRLKVPQGTVDEPLLVVLQIAPLSYYGVLARHRLGRTAELPSSRPASAPASQKVDLHFADRIRALSRFGLFTEAQQELLELEAGADDPVAVCTLYCEAFDYYRAHKPFRKTLADALGPEPSPDTEPLWRMAYPMPFSDVMQKAEKVEKLPRDLLVSLVREESAFRLDAGSWANAYGLTQLLVSTALATANDMNYAGKVDADALRQPHVALTLGAHHLNMLQRRFRAVPLILAGYNAGERAVTSWLAKRGALPLDEFIEEIPIDETRGYVKRILSTWTIYRQLGGREPPLLDLGPVRAPRKGS